MLMTTIATSATYTWNWSSVLSLQSLAIMGRGLLYTLLVSVLALIFGNVIGLVVASVRMSNQKILSGIAYVYIEFFRTTPALVQLIWIFYVVPILFNISLDPITAGVVAPEASRVAVPVFIGAGERDVVPDPWAEPGAYRSSSDVTVVVVPRMAHMHNFAGTRARLWSRLHGWVESLTSAGG